jgi:pyruvate dehydrogenase (quinone)
MAASLSGTLATMGPAVPYAIAAKFAHPDRPSSRSSATARCR